MAVSRTQTAYRRTRVVELVAEGANFDEAARAVGYANRSGAFKAFYRAIGDREVEAVDTHRALELARLDALQRVLWERVELGDIKAIETVLRIIDRRIRLLGLDQVASKDEGSRPLVDPGFWEMLRETYDGKLENYWADGISPEAGETTSG